MGEAHQRVRFIFIGELGEVNMTPEEKAEEIREIRAELKALSSPDIWGLPPEKCSEKTILRRRRCAYLGNRLSLLLKEK